MSEIIVAEDNALMEAFYYSKNINVTSISSLEQLAYQTGMSQENFDNFRSLVIKYCRANLVKMTVYFPSPYITTFSIQEVSHVLKMHDY